MRKFKFKEHRKKISSIDTLLKDIRRLRKLAVQQGLEGPWYFRGDDKPNLKPPIGQPKRFAGKGKPLDPEQEKKLLNRFRRFAYSEFNREPSEWGSPIPSPPLWASDSDNGLEHQPLSGAIFRLFSNEK